MGDAGSASAVEEDEIVVTAPRNPCLGLGRQSEIARCEIARDHALRRADPYAGLRLFGDFAGVVWAPGVPVFGGLRWLRFCGCLVEGTPVATPDGLRPIEDIAVGDQVLAWDPETGETSTQTVTALIRPEPQATYELVLLDAGGEREEFFASADHPWFVVGRGWVETINLAPGDRIVSARGADLVVQSLAPTGRTEQTYNLEVDGPHTFLVGEDGVVVHNTVCGWVLGQFKSAARWANQMARRGWTDDLITGAIAHGRQFPAPNNINPANGATRFVSPTTGQSVIRDNVTGEILHVGGPGYRY